MDAALPYGVHHGSSSSDIFFSSTHMRTTSARPNTAKSAKARNALNHAKKSIDFYTCARFERRGKSLTRCCDGGILRALMWCKIVVFCLVWRNGAAEAGSEIDRLHRGVGLNNQRYPIPNSVTMCRGRYGPFKGRETGITREAPYRSLSAEGNPERSILTKVLRALGTRLTIQPAAT
jgi:hypothetical protein